MSGVIVLDSQCCVISSWDCIAISSHHTRSPTMRRERRGTRLRIEATFWDVSDGWNKFLLSDDLSWWNEPFFGVRGQRRATRDSPRPTVTLFAIALGSAFWSRRSCDQNTPIMYHTEPATLGGQVSLSTLSRYSTLASQLPSLRVE